jgi:hypothetical protein
MSPIKPALFLGLTLFGLGATAGETENLRFFEMEVRPLLANECYQCHSAEKEKGGLRLDHRDFILKGGETGPAVVVGKPDESPMIEAVRRSDHDFVMPPKKALTESQVAVLEKWVALGAPWPAETAKQGTTDENGFTEKDRNWWAIQPVADPAPPKAGEGWAKNPIDTFIAAKLAGQDLKPAGPADAGELVCRLHFDLHGLPPSSEDVVAFEKAFAADPDKATADLADKLLASPRYGERWGQHWLDVVRYAESDGYRADDFRPETWMYRDYVIRSLNEDKPYDRFIREQLAADEFAADDPATLIATAFLRLGIYEWNQRNARMQWDLILTEMTNVTSEAFLGLGMGCAQCHDHKFDPILQKDYFALQSFLNSTWWPENQTLASPQQRAAHEAKLAKWEEATKAIRAELDAMTAPVLEGKRKGAVIQFPEDVQAIYWKKPGDRTAHEEQLAQLVQRQVDFDFRRTDWKKTFAKDEKKLARYTELTESLKRFDSLKPAPLPTAFITTDTGPEAADTILKRRGKEEVVEPAFLTLLGEEKPVIKPTAATTGRRSALADWIADEKNPFTARVMVNRVWQRHFAEGLVATPNDFGMLGEAPSHPELLDWLTSRFLEDDWKLKKLHRLIVTSATYRQTARREPTSDEEIADPGNRLLWRYPPMRLDAEQIRDATLAASGELQHREGGPSVEGTAPNRSVYMKKRRNTPDTLIGEFDAPAGFSSTPNRIPTTTPNQSLLLVNGPWSMGRAEAFAKRVLKGGPAFGPEQVREAYRIAYGREALSTEVEGALAFIEAQTGSVSAPETATPDKFPNESGLRPASQFFSETGGVKVGEKALWLQPGSRFEKLDLGAVKLPEEDFTIEVVAVLDGVYADASVNTLLSRWNGSQDEIGWSLGVTSTKSRFDPRNFILQIVGDDFQKNRLYEVVPSGLRVPLGKPVYLAAAISARPSKDDLAKGSVTFSLKDLSDPGSPLQSETIAHQIVGGLSVKDGVSALLGGRAQTGHHWDGQLARLSVSEGVLKKEQLLVFPQRSEAESLVPEARRILDWTFAGNDGETPAPGTAWVRNAKDAAPPGVSPKLLGAVTDFCHAMLNSNEFLYLH